MKKIYIDFSKQTGRIKPMHGVNNGPVPEGKFRGVNNYESFRALGIPYIRVHDSSFFSAYGGEHTIDIDGIFRNRLADEGDPDNYDFAMTDYYIKSNHSTGAKTLYRLGSRIEHEPKKYQTVPYYDFEKFARICEHIILHLCYGWANGTNMSIPYWEIWNEADNWDETYQQNPCWQGTFEEYLDLYAVTSKHLKKRFPDLKIGGPAFARSFAGYNYFERFIDYVARNRLPLDFYSWHLYGTDPHEYVQQANEIRKALDQVGYTHTELVMDEWNYVSDWFGDEHRSSLHAIQTEVGAAFDASVMLAMQKTSMDLMTYYDARGYCEFNGIWNPITFEELKGYWAFMNFNKLYQLGNEVYSESSDENLYVVAACNQGQYASEIAYFAPKDLDETDVEITIKSLPENSMITIYLTDRDSDNRSICREHSLTKEACLCIHLMPNSIVYIDISETCFDPNII